MDNVIDRYPVEELRTRENSEHDYDADDDDDGTMPENVDTLREAVIGRKIVSAEKRTVEGRWGRSDPCSTTWTTCKKTCRTGST
jgi:hypothetical protein